MSNIQVRRLGDIGVITDVNPYDLPPNAFSMGNNIRFNGGKLSRSPAFKGILNTTAPTPVFCYSYSIAGSNDRVGVVNITGTSYQYTSGVETLTTPTVFTPVSGTEPFTFCMLANLGYLNRNSDVPQYFAPSSTLFTKLPNWPATYTCRSLRAFKSYLIALNITKGGSTNPTMFKWSDITPNNSYPVSWDETDTTKSAGENTLQECTSSILDGMALRDAFIAYTTNQVHLIEYTADSNVFRTRKLFDGPGIINTNCVVEIEGKHYVFGKSDIYSHDGISPMSIADQRVKDFIFNNLNTSQTDKFFVAHNPLLTEFMCCYVSGDAFANFPIATYCNRAAVYNYRNNTWAFRDLPNATGAALTSIPATAYSYTTISPFTYSNIGSTYSALAGNAPKGLVFSSPLDTPSLLTTSKLYAYDAIVAGSFSEAVDYVATTPAFAQRVGVDMDEQGASLNSYKVAKTLYPQGNALSGTGNLSFSFGATLFNDMQPSFSTAVVFDPTSQYKVDIPQGIGGRYLAWKVTDSGSFSFELSGLDVDATVTGKR